MAQDWVINGLPGSIAHDAWWLDAEPPAAPDSVSRTRRARPQVRLAALVLLIALADALFYRHAVGLSLALFAAALYAASALLCRRFSPVALALVSLGILPVIDYVQALSVLILCLGLIAGIGWTALPPTRTADLPRIMLALIRRLPFRGIIDLVQGLAALRTVPNLGGTARLWRNWALPVGGSLVLVSLLAEANPVLDDWLSNLTRLPFDTAETLRRLMFWLGVGLVVWPLLTADQTAPLALRSRRLPALPLGLNGTSVANALIAFNLVLGLQTAMDALYLWSGAALPPGMTLATYAHRGAYPLLATALLAGAFALAARPWLHERPLLKPLLLLWLAQNVLLTLSAVYRLDLYVGAFGLTYLRLHAGIWMLLVASGLALTLWQVAAGKSNLWLVLRCSLLGGLTLYACAFVNFAAIIATVNLREATHDIPYICSLGPTAAAAIRAEWRHDCDDLSCDDLWECDDWAHPPVIEGWRDWGFRDWLVIRYLDQHPLPAAPLQEAPVEDPRRG